MKVVILGGTGMLGSMVRRFLASQPGYELTCPSRYGLNATTATLTDLLDLLKGHDYCINCIGLIKPRIDESSPRSVCDAIQVNAAFPHFLAEAAEFAHCKVIQIATDCVYSGTGQSAGVHDELSPHDPLDVYGKTKSLGEVVSPNVRHLRCSIVGPELRGHLSLLDWFLGQPAGSMIKGFNNHRWNGITTLAFAKICHGIMREGFEFYGPQHIVPYNAATKAELLSHFAYFYHRDDIRLEEVTAPIAVDRSLSTLHQSLNGRLWEAAGYSERPYIQQMIEELAAYK